MRPSPKRLLLFVLAFAFLVGIVQIGLISIAFDKLGLSPQSAYLLLMGTLAGSMVNVPLFTLRGDASTPPEIPPRPPWWPPIPMPPYTGKTIVAVNVGGCLLPVAFSLYLIAHNPLNPIQVVAAVMSVAFIASKLSVPVAGIGIGMPVLVAPVTAALIASLLDPGHRAALAYISGTLGVLIGADLMRLKDIRRMRAPFASIGGAGTFDGVFITGLVAVLLA